MSRAQGRTVSFRNALVILTSNIGSRMISSAGDGTGLAGVFTRPRQSAAVGADIRRSLAGEDEGAEGEVVLGGAAETDDDDDAMSRAARQRMVSMVGGLAGLVGIVCWQCVAALLARKEQSTGHQDLA
jgi:hypothetical protein